MHIVADIFTHTHTHTQDGKLVKVFTNVESKVKRHSEEVLEALKALQT